MSNYREMTKHPDTGEMQMADWLDDHFGKHRYGVRFPDGKIFSASKIGPICGVTDGVAGMMEYAPFSLRDIQHQHKDWQLKNFGEHPSWHPLLGVGEEVGELQHAFLKREQGIRGTREEHDAAIKDAVADIMIYLCDFCNCEKIDMLEELNKTWIEVSKRDWKKNSVNGVAAPS